MLTRSRSTSRKLHERFPARSATTLCVVTSGPRRSSMRVTRSAALPRSALSPTACAHTQASGNVVPQLVSRCARPCPPTGGPPRPPSISEELAQVLRPAFGPGPVRRTWLPRHPPACVHAQRYVANSDVEGQAVVVRCEGDAGRLGVGGSVGHGTRGWRGQGEGWVRRWVTTHREGEVHGRRAR
eukprot:scaffold2788_cov69-Phaeocystis_antarctica.AAC.4